MNMANGQQGDITMCYVQFPLSFGKSCSLPWHSLGAILPLNIDISNIYRDCISSHL